MPAWRKKPQADRVDGEKKADAASTGVGGMLRPTEVQVQATQQPQSTVTPQEAMALFAKLSTFSKLLAEPFVSREEECKVLTLALMTKMNALFVGKPGVAKTAMVKRATLLMGGQVFKIQLNKDTKMDEIIGGFNFKDMVEKNELNRVSKKMIQEADVAVMDETFDASSMVLNALRSMLEERELNDGHGNMVKLKLRSVIGTTNIIPDEEEKGLHGVYDRFHFRQFVQAVPDEKREDLLFAAHNIRLANGKSTPIEKVIDVSDFDKIYELVMNVDVKPLYGEIVRLWKLFEKQEGMEFSDRRVSDAAQVAIAANAVLNGRDRVNFSDLMVLKYVLPKDEDQARRVQTILEKEVLTPEKCMAFLDGVEKNIAKANDVMAGKDKQHGKTLIDLDDLNDAKVTLSRIGKGSGSDDVERRAEDIGKELDTAISKAAKWNEAEKARLDKEAAAAAAEKAKRRGAFDDDDEEAERGGRRGAGGQASRGAPSRASRSSKSKSRKGKTVRTPWYDSKALMRAEEGWYGDY